MRKPVDRSRRVELPIEKISKVSPIQRLLGNVRKKFPVLRILFFAESILLIALLTLPVSSKTGLAWIWVIFVIPGAAILTLLVKQKLPPASKEEE